MLNPFNLPANVLKLSLLGGGVAGGFWVVWRNQERSKLISELEQNRHVSEARIYAKSAGLGDVHAWLVDPGGIKAKAIELIPYMNYVTAAEALPVVLASLPKIPRAVEGGVLTGVIGKGLEELAKVTGVQIPRSVQQEVKGLAQTQQGQTADQILSSTDELWDWSGMLEAERARPNGDPNATWDQFLAGLYR